MTRDIVLAVDLGGTKVAAALVDRNGKVFAHQSIPVDASSTLAPVNQIIDLARELAGGRVVRGRIAAMGVAVPGLVRRDGTVWAPNLPGWKRMPLARRLHQALRVPVAVESDRNAAVLGEAWRGAARGKNDAIVLMLGTGIGTGILSGGRLIPGAHELSGCAGWMVVTDQHGPEMQGAGQLESLAAGPRSPARQKRNWHRAWADCWKKFLLMQSPPTKWQRPPGAGIMPRSKSYCGRRLLGYGVANLVSLFDPEIVVIGGGLAKASDLFLDALRKAMKERAQPSPQDRSAS